MLPDSSSVMAMPTEIRFSLDGQKRCRAPGDSTIFARGNLAPGRPGYAYRNDWFQRNDADGSVEASGRFGQKKPINPKREVVIVELSSTVDQPRRSTSAQGAAKVAARVTDSPFNNMVNAVLAQLRQ